MTIFSPSFFESSIVWEGPVHGRRRAQSSVNHGWRSWAFR